MPQITNSFPFQFYGTTIEVHMADDGHWYIRLDHMCEHLGLDSKSQRRKLQEHPAIEDRCVSMMIDTPYRESTRKKEVWFIDIQILHLWLGMIQVFKSTGGITGKAHSLSKGSCPVALAAVSL